MKKIFFAFCVFMAGLAVAQFFFGVDIEGLLEGFLDFLGELLDGPG